MTTKAHTPKQAPARATKAPQFDLGSRFSVAPDATDTAANFSTVPMLPPSGAYGRDGRGPFVYDLGEVIDRVRAEGADIPVFLDHAPGKAFGWIDHQALPTVQPDGSVEWPVEYTEEGLALLQSKGYRYNSPTWWVMQDPSVTDRQAGRIVGFQENSLTNLPNQYLRSLNSQGAGSTGADSYTGYQSSLNTTEFKPMTPDQLALIGLAEDATAEQITAALTTLSANSARALAITEAAGAAADADAPAVVEAAAQSRVLSGALVSKQALDEATARADAAVTAQQAAETALATVRAERAEQSAVAAVDAAITAGKFVPAAREALMTQARADLATFNALAAAMPVHAAAQSSTSVATQAVQDENYGLSADQLALCKQNAIDPAIFARNLRASRA